MTNYAMAPALDSESAPNLKKFKLNGHWQVQLRAHARAASGFASAESYTIGSINYPFAMLLHIELA